MTPSMSKAPPTRQRLAFSLVELLVVIAVLGLLATFTGPALSSIFQSRQFSQGLNEVASFLELSRDHAVARRTYVWVAFQETDGPSGQEIRFAAVGSLDGSGTNLSAGNLYDVSRVRRAPEALLTDWSTLSAATRDLEHRSTPQSVSANASGVTFSVGGIDFNSGNTLTFSPRGEVLLQGAVAPHDGYASTVDISLKQARGGTLSGEDASVLVDGATGAVRILQVQ